MGTPSPANTPSPPDVTGEEAARNQFTLVDVFAVMTACGLAFFVGHLQLVDAQTHGTGRTASESWWAAIAWPASAIVVTLPTTLAFTFSVRMLCTRRLVDLNRGEWLLFATGAVFGAPWVLATLMIAFPSPIVSALFGLSARVLPLAVVLLACTAVLMISGRVEWNDPPRRGDRWLAWLGYFCALGSFVGWLTVTFLYGSFY